MSSFLNRAKGGAIQAFTTVKANPILGVWLLAGILSATIPLMQWGVNRGKYYSAYGYYIAYENEQREYEEAQNQNDDQNNDNANYYYRACSWWNARCRMQQYKYAMYDEDGGNGDGYQETLPAWYIFLGGQTEEMQRWEEENTGQRAEDNMSAATSGQKFVYAWTLIMFLALLSFGVYTFVKPFAGARRNLLVLLVVFAQFSLINLITSAQGMISQEDRAFENSPYGWYGQIGVLMTYTHFWFLLFTALWSIGFGVQAFKENKALKSNASESLYQLSHGAA